MGALERREREEKGKKFGNRTKGKELSPNEVNTRQTKTVRAKKNHRKEKRDQIGINDRR